MPPSTFGSLGISCGTTGSSFGSFCPSAADAMVDDISPGIAVSNDCFPCTRRYRGAALRELPSTALSCVKQASSQVSFVVIPVEELRVVGR